MTSSSSSSSESVPVQLSSAGSRPATKSLVPKSSSSMLLKSKAEGIGPVIEESTRGVDIAEGPASIRVLLLWLFRESSAGRSSSISKSTRSLGLLISIDKFDERLALSVGGEPTSRIGSSLGDAGGAGAVKSISGGSVLILVGSGTLASVRFFVIRRAGFFFSAWTGVLIISRGGVKRSAGGSYGGMGVIERLRTETFPSCLTASLDVGI